MFKYKVQIKKVSGRLNESVLPSKNLVVKSKSKKSKSAVLTEASKFFKKKYGLMLIEEDYEGLFDSEEERNEVALAWYEEVAHALWARAFNWYSEYEEYDEDEEEVEVVKPRKTATKKKKLNCSSAEFLTIDEGFCVQIMHMGSFDNEPETVGIMDKFLEENGYTNDFSESRLHHEIYLSDARKVEPEKWKTVIRHPIRKV